MAERFSKDYGVAVDWQPYLLRPDAPAEGWALPQHIAARMNQPDNPLISRAKALGLPLVERTWVPNSRRALAANEHVRTFGLEKLHAFHSAVNDRYWAKGEDLSKWETLEGAMRDIGLDPSQLRDSTDESSVDLSIAKAHALGIHAVPTYVFYDGDKPVGAIQGAQDYAVFQRAAKQLGL
jgi:predicted DsbA family dithiol-disulfide isomerase